MLIKIVFRRYLFFLRGERDKIIIIWEVLGYRIRKGYLEEVILEMDF